MTGDPVLHPNSDRLQSYVEAVGNGPGADVKDEKAAALRNDSFRKAVQHAEEFIFGERA